MNNRKHSLRIGVISDIHADMTSLESAVRRLDDANVDMILCAGDLVERGGDGSAVIELIRDRSILCVQGNHDENAIRHARLSANYADPRDETPPLDGDTLDFLEKLPASRTLAADGTKLMVTHATPSDNGGAAFQDESNRKLSKRFKKDLARVDADILIVGHTHYPFDLEFRGKRILNPGSVCGLQSRDSHTYGIFDLSDQIFAVFDVSTGEVCRQQA